MYVRQYRYRLEYKRDHGGLTPSEQARWDRIERANKTEAVCYSDCEIMDADTGEILVTRGQRLNDMHRAIIVCLNAALEFTTDHRHERGSDELGGLLNIVGLIALIVFLAIIAHKFNLDLVAGLQWIRALIVSAVF